MNEILLLFTKEFKYFFMRSHVVKWALMIIAVGFLAPFIRIPLIPFDVDTTRTTIFFVAFVAVITPINMGLDYVIGEKVHKTMETLLTLPMNVLNVITGKVLFGTLITFTLYTIMMLSASTLLFFVKNINVIEEFGVYTLLLFSLAVLLSQIIVNMLTCMLSVALTNYKAIGYGMTGVDAILIIILAYVIINFENIGLVYYALLLLSINIVLVIIIRKRLSKSIIIKHLK